MTWYEKRTKSHVSEGGQKRVEWKDLGETTNDMKRVHAGEDWGPRKEWLKKAGRQEGRRGGNEMEERRRLEQRTGRMW